MDYPIYNLDENGVWTRVKTEREVYRWVLGTNPDTIPTSIPKIYYQTGERLQVRQVAMENAIQEMVDDRKRLRAEKAIRGQGYDSTLRSAREIAPIAEMLRAAVEDKEWLTEMKAEGRSEDTIPTLPETTGSRKIDI